MKDAPFKDMHPNSRVWIYGSARPLTAEEQSSMAASLQSFASQWTAHQVPLSAAAQVLHNHFVVFVVDESKAGASGCSIDKSVHWVKEWGSHLGIDFFDRLAVWYQTESGDIASKPLALWKADLEKGIFDGETLVFDQTVQSLEALSTAWLKPVKDTWLGRFVPVQ